MYERAAALVEAEDFDRALDALQDLLGIDPSHGMANFRIGEIALRASQTQLAIDYLNKAEVALAENIRSAGAGPDEWLALLAAQFYLGRTQDLRDSGKRAVERARDGNIDPEALATRLMEIGQHENAAAAARLAVDANPAHANPLKLLARALVETDDQDGALLALTKASELTPGDPEIHDLIGGFYDSDNITADLAAAAYRRSVDLEPTPDRYHRLADALRLQAHFDQAIEVYREAIANGGEQNAGLLLGCALTLNLAHLEDQAAPIFDRALQALVSLDKMQPDNAFVQGLIIRTLWSMGQHGKAMEVLTALKGELGPASFSYLGDRYSESTPHMLETLKEVIGGRDLFLMLHGPSAKILEENITAFADQDICYMTMFSYRTFEETFLNKIGREVGLVVITNHMQMGNHFEQIEEFLSRPAKNVLITGKGCLERIGQDPDAFEKRFSDRVLYFPQPSNQAPPTPTNPLNFPICNTLSAMLPFVVHGEAQRVFLFGADGAAAEDEGARSRFGAESQEYRFEDPSEKKRQMMARTLVVDTLSFDDVAGLTLAATSALYERPIPPIYNVSPDSCLNLFEKIDIEACKSAVRG